MPSTTSVFGTPLKSNERVDADGFPRTWGGARRNVWKAYQFFRGQTGVVGRDAIVALGLAKAERRAKALGFRFVWAGDDDPDLGDHEFWCPAAKARVAYDEGRPVDLAAFSDRNRRTGAFCSHEVLYCVVYAENDTEGEHPLASLSSIIDPSDDYSRIVEAELAMEALENYDAEQARVSSDAQLRGEARELYADDNVRVEDDAEVVRGESGEVWVQALVRVPRKEEP